MQNLDEDDPQYEITLSMARQQSVDVRECKRCKVQDRFEHMHVVKTRDGIATVCDPCLQHALTKSSTKKLSSCTYLFPIKNEANLTDECVFSVFNGPTSIKPRVRLVRSTTYTPACTSE